VTAPAWRRCVLARENLRETTLLQQLLMRIFILDVPEKVGGYFYPEKACGDFLSWETATLIRPKYREKCQCLWINFPV